jgi:CBS domain containing-hemolysin-like protein
MTALVLYISLALGVSFLCSLLEATFLSITHGYIRTLCHKHRKSGRMLQSLKDRIDRPLVAILTLNTVANTVGAAGVGAQVLRLYTERYPAAGHAGEVVAVASGTLTFLILVFSEIIPKTLGAVYWKRLAPAAGYMITALIILIYPLVVMFETLSKLISGKRYKHTMSREEMAAVAEIGKADGTLLTQETRVIQNLLRLNKIRAKDVLTPRSVLLAFQKDKTVQETVEKHSPIRFSRIPVYDKDLDDITGIVHRYKLLRAYAEERSQTSLAKLSTPIHAVPETKSVASILDEFLRRQEQVFLVVDEYGGTTGIITLEDAIETLLGVEIVDEFDTVEDMRKLAAQIGKKHDRVKEFDIPKPESGS